jgi:hypothetical protein
MTNYMNRLAQGSGATSNPAQAAGMGLQQQQANQTAQMQGLGAIGQGVSGLSNYSSGTGGSSAGSSLTNPGAYNSGYTVDPTSIGPMMDTESVTTNLGDLSAYF